MLQIHIITLGTLKEGYWREAAAEYIKRLTPYARVEIVELKEESFEAKTSPKLVKSREAEKITKALEKVPSSYIVALDEHGKQFSSTALANELGTITMHHGSSLVFIIGGPLGLDTSVLKKAHLTLSFGQLTITHQMVRIILLEQFYRAMMILHNRTYHY